MHTSDMRLGRAADLIKLAPRDSVCVAVDGLKSISARIALAQKDGRDIPYRGLGFRRYHHRVLLAGALLFQCPQLVLT